MNKRIKVYCIIISIIYVGVIFSNFSSSISAFRSGMDLGVESAKSERNLTVFHVKVVPPNGAFTFPERMINSLTGEEINSEVSALKIILFEDDNVSHSGFYFFLEILKIVISFLFIGIVIYLPILFFKIIRAVTRGNIIENKVISRISRMGWLIIIFFLSETLTEIINVVCAQEVLAIDGYNIVMDFSNYSFLILGIIILLLSEILRVSHTLKEEQELTI